MSLITFEHHGDFSKTSRFLRAFKFRTFNFKKYGEMGVTALASNTPQGSGKTAESWSYEILRSPGLVRLIWKNSNINDGVPIAVILQYGHATGTGGYVQGYDYINPAIRPIFDQIAADLWKEVRNS